MMLIKSVVLIFFSLSDKWNVDDDLISLTKDLASIFTLSNLVQYKCAYENVGIFCGETFDFPNQPEIKRQVNRIFNENGIQLVVIDRNLLLLPKRLVVFDMDSTLIQEEFIDELAKVSPNYQKIKHLTEITRKGEMEFQQSLVERVQLLEGISCEHFEQVQSALRFTKGVLEVMDFCRERRIKTAIISGGFISVASFVQKKLNMDYSFANELEIIGTVFTGRLLGKIIDREEKMLCLQRLAEELEIPLENTVAVGDGANDLDMLNAAGVGISWQASVFVRNSVSRSMFYN